MIVELEGLEGLAYVPLKIAGEHAHRHVGADTPNVTGADRPDLDIDGLERAGEFRLVDSSSPSTCTSVQSLVDVIDSALYIKNGGIGSWSYPTAAKEAVVIIGADQFFGEG